MFNCLVRNRWDNVAALRQLTDMPTLFLSALQARRSRAPAQAAPTPVLCCRAAAALRALPHLPWLRSRVS